MILFMNTFIANDSFHAANLYDRGLLPSNYTRLDILKYTLASYSVIKWDKVVLYIGLDTMFYDQWQNLTDFIKSIYKDPIIYTFRNASNEEWSKAIQQLPKVEQDDIIWFSGNHDHIFIDSNLKLVEKIEKVLKDLAKSHDYVSCIYSHWPELIGSTFDKKGKINWITGMCQLYDFNGACEENHGDYSVRKIRSTDSIQIINRKLLEEWFSKYHYLGDLRRVDGAVSCPEIVTVIPHKEIVRHFDVYSHNAVSINACPPLVIPEGFFEKTMKISYGFEERITGYIHINPAVENYSCFDPKGVDMRGILDDIPLFWRDRIVDVRIAEGINELLMLRKRNLAVYKMAKQCCNMSYEEMSVKLPSAFIADPANVEQVQDKNDNVFDKIRGENLISCMRHNIQKSKPRYSIVLLDFHFQCGSHIVQQLRQQLGEDREFEIIWLSFSQHNSLMPVVKDTAADAIIRYTYVDTYNKNIALNAATAIARGDIITYMELNFAQTYLDGNFINRYRDFNAKVNSKEWMIHHVLNEAIYKGNLESVKNTTLDILLKGPTTPHELINCLTIPRQIVFDLGGFDESELFNDNRGGLYDMYYRSKWAGVHEYSLDVPYAVSVVVDKPKGNLPFSLFEQKRFSWLRSQPIRKNILFNNK